MTGIYLRAATVADAAPIADVYLDSRLTFVAFAPLAHSEADVREWIMHALIPMGDVTVAEDAEQIVGMMATSCDGYGVGWVEHLYLLPSHVGQGVGSRLLTQAKKALSSPIRLYTFQQNQGARRFYERHGFVATEFSDGADNEEGVPDVLYEWRQYEGEC